MAVATRHSLNRRQLDRFKQEYSLDLRVSRGILKECNVLFEVMSNDYSYFRYTVMKILLNIRFCRPI